MTSPIHRILTIVAGALGLLCIACSSNEAEALNADDFEDAIYSVYGAEYQAAVEVLTIECARHNGLQLWTPPPLTPPRALELAPGLEGEERTAAIGSGIVAGAKEIQAIREQRQTETGPSIEPAPAGEERHVLDVGPITAPNGERFDGGCRWWATEQAQGSPAFEHSLRTAESYSDFLVEAIEGSNTVAELHNEWSVCMASQGYEGLERQGDQIDLITAESSRWQNGETTYDQALEFDIRATTAAVGCNSLVDPRFRIFRDSVAAQFLEANPNALDS